MPLYLHKNGIFTGGTLFWLFDQIKTMKKPVVKIGNNTQYNFNTSTDISYWAIKYNTSIDEIQKIFADSGNSISKTLEILRERNQEA